MINRNFPFPSLAAKAITRLPATPPSFVLAKLLNALLLRKPEYQNLSPLYGKRISILVRDAGLQFRLILDERGFRPAPGHMRPDLSISASAHDFIKLASRREDPDSLFFSRRLVIEGDTELGLIAKNTLDAIDLSKLLLPGFLPARLMPWIKTQ
ncbi:MAG: hypothetical protein RL194_1509 [Pseudomonadota bacterium]|jgi:predicted lipid carrier protein YhbT